MDQFAGDIAAMLEVALIGAGLVVLYYALKEGSKLMKTAGYIMIIGGTLGLLCTGYWWFRYHENGVFYSPVNKTVHLMQHNADDAGHHIFPE